MIWVGFLANLCCVNAVSLESEGVIPDVVKWFGWAYAVWVVWAYREMWAIRPTRRIATKVRDVVGIWLKEACEPLLQDFTGRVQVTANTVMTDAQATASGVIAEMQTTAMNVSQDLAFRVELASQQLQRTATAVGVRVVEGATNACIARREEHENLASGVGNALATGVGSVIGCNELYRRVLGASSWFQTCVCLVCSWWTFGVVAAFIGFLSLRIWFVKMWRGDVVPEGSTTIQPAVGPKSVVKDPQSRFKLRMVGYYLLVMFSLESLSRGFDAERVGAWLDKTVRIVHTMFPSLSPVSTSAIRIDIQTKLGFLKRCHGVCFVMLCITTLSEHVASQFEPKSANDQTQPEVDKDMDEIVAEAASDGSFAFSGIWLLWGVAFRNKKAWSMVTLLGVAKTLQHLSILSFGALACRCAGLVSGTDRVRYANHFDADFIPVCWVPDGMWLDTDAKPAEWPRFFGLCSAIRTLFDSEEVPETMPKGGANVWHNPCGWIILWLAGSQNVKRDQLCDGQLAYISVSELQEEFHSRAMFTGVIILWTATHFVTTFWYPLVGLFSTTTFEAEAAKLQPEGVMKKVRVKGGAGKNKPGRVAKTVLYSHRAGKNKPVSSKILNQFEIYENEDGVIEFFDKDVTKARYVFDDEGNRVRLADYVGQFDGVRNAFEVVDYEGNDLFDRPDDLYEQGDYFAEAGKLPPNKLPYDWCTGCKARAKDHPEGGCPVAFSLFSVPSPEAIAPVEGPPQLGAVTATVAPSPAAAAVQHGEAENETIKQQKAERKKAAKAAKLEATLAEKVGSPGLQPEGAMPSAKAGAADLRCMKRVKCNGAYALCSLISPGIVVFPAHIWKEGCSVTIHDPNSGDEAVVPGGIIRSLRDGPVGASYESTNIPYDIAGFKREQALKCCSGVKNVIANWVVLRAKVPSSGYKSPKTGVLVGESVGCCPIHEVRDEGIRHGATTELGDCGSILLVAKEDQSRVALGMHVAGSMGTNHCINLGCAFPALIQRLSLVPEGNRAAFVDPYATPVRGNSRLNPRANAFGPRGTPGVEGSWRSTWVPNATQPESGHRKFRGAPQGRH